MVGVKKIILANLLPASTFLSGDYLLWCFPLLFQREVENVAVGKQSDSKTNQNEEPTLENRPMKLPLAGSKRSKLCNDAVSASAK
jgi:hypothetical protein